MLESVNGELRIASNTSLSSVLGFARLRNIGSALETSTAPITIIFNSCASYLLRGISLCARDAA